MDRILGLASVALCLYLEGESYFSSSRDLTSGGATIEWPLLAVEEHVLSKYVGDSGGSGAYHHHENV